MAIAGRCAVGLLLLFCTATRGWTLPASPRITSHPTARRARMTAEDESTYAATSSPTKRLVSALTAVVNGVFAAFGGDANEAVRPPKPGVVTPSELAEGIRADYEERCYLWSMRFLLLRIRSALFACVPPTTDLLLCRVFAMRSGRHRPEPL